MSVEGVRSGPHPLAPARQTVKRSLQELSRSINGDAKTDVQALFLIHVALHASKVEFKPSIVELTQVRDPCLIHT